MSELLAKFVCISDSHFGEVTSYVYRGFSPHVQFAKVRTAFNNELADSDLLLHLGDVSGDASRHAEMGHYIEAAREFSDIAKPKLFVAGNHDRSAGVLQLIRPGLIAPRATSHDRVDYVYAQEDWQILALDSSVYTQRAGHLSSEQFAWTDDVLSKASVPTVVLIHHPSHTLGCRWIDETMLLTERREFHKLMVKHRSKITLVLFGHVHDAVSQSVDGVLYSSVPPSIFSFDTSREAKDGAVAPDRPVGYALVTLYRSGARVSYRLLT